MHLIGKCYTYLTANWRQRKEFGLVSANFHSAQSSPTDSKYIGEKLVSR